MVPIERDEVARLMAQMAAGDQSAVFVFIASFGGRLAGVVRRQLFEFGRRDVAADRHELDYLVQSAAFALLDRAAGWSPDGALPWTWAERAIRAEVVAYLGHPSVELDPDHAEGAGIRRGAGTDRSGPRRVGGAGRVGTGPDGAGGPVTPDPDEFDDLVARHPTVALLDEAIEAVANARDRRVHLEYRLQKRSGDVSPAHTVAAEFGLSPANVRQIDSRVRRRLVALVEADDRYAGLRGLGWLAA